VAATSSVGPLHQDEVDQLLGVVPEEHPTKAQSDR